MFLQTVANSRQKIAQLANPFIRDGTVSLLQKIRWPLTLQCVSAAFPSWDRPFSFTLAQGLCFVCCKWQLRAGRESKSSSPHL